jgi:hypothetical protein
MDEVIQTAGPLGHGPAATVMSHPPPRVFTAPVFVRMDNLGKVLWATS